jgi:fatty acid desaturase
MSLPQSATSFTPSTSRLPLPAAVNRRRVVWSYVIAIGLYHLVALLALVPWFFSWTGVALAVLGLYVFGTLGINLCYHRLLTHPGHAGAVGGGPSAASRARRPPRRSP